MIEKEKIRELVKSYLQETEEKIIKSITNDIILDAEAVIYSLVRQAVAQERENIYRKKQRIRITNREA